MLARENSRETAIPRLRKTANHASSLDQLGQHDSQTVTEEDDALRPDLHVRSSDSNYKNLFVDQSAPLLKYPSPRPSTNTQSTLTQSAHFDDETRRTSRKHRVRRSVIHWAPLNIGLERRLQTFIVLCHTLTIAIFLTFFFFSCAIPLFWPLLLPYLIYISLFSSAATSGTLGGRSNRLRSLRIWSLYASYFPARLHRSEVLLPTRKYIFGYHPHGIISHGAFAAFATEALGFSSLFPGITNTLLTLDSNFRIPFYREYALAMGLASVSRDSCENILSKGGTDGEGMGRAITIVVGGARESLDALPHTLRLVLKRRKGFIKLAIRTGADLVPVLAFGENDLYDQVRSDRHPIIHKFQMLIKHTMGFTIPLFHARGVFNYDVGLMPYRRPLNIVVGRPIQVIQQQNRDQIDDEYIEELHSKYIEELKRLWERNKEVYAKDRISEVEIVA
ncbi:diacylglycerol acyltransferase type 2A [Aspergillus clavatus NRRL 1]|uniref:Diacylglycerol O-acyltransferase n=1 Tax=Aspergillus clavatus (strain ATCC 1007 / CBS 513.65 / DSM 816 / NCTC 3887 / NRRL 1 / QM 1276 / 107) TaxID=344612 RepID=A1CD57_ASPCL|nr:diacylglycerol o-acyltransferase [Aspergillus clavatus NRRL 1]EAW11784.1 diacylglycerol o-acyltransferase [Aspergillus clavatus NRRL 1]